MKSSIGTKMPPGESSAKGVCSIEFMHMPADGVSGEIRCSPIRRTRIRRMHCSYFGCLRAPKNG